jgi:hypothetical protein
MHVKDVTHNMTKACSFPQPGRESRENGGDGVKSGKEMTVVSKQPQ